MYLVGTWPHMLYVVVCWLSTLSKRKNIRILVGCWSCDRFGRELVAGFVYGEIGRTLDKNSADQHRDQLSECGAVKMYTYADANLYHDMLNGKAITTVLHF